MAYRYLIYSTGTTFSGTIVRESAISNPGGNEAALYTDFIIPEIQPLYLWRVTGGTTVVPNTEANINAYEASIAPAPQSKDNITYGEVTGYTATTDTFIKTKLDTIAFDTYSGLTKTLIGTKVDKVTGAVAGNIPTFITGGDIADTGLNAADIVAAGSGVSKTQFNAYTGATEIVIDSKLATTLFQAYSAATKIVIDSKLATALFQAYSGVTDLFIKTKLDRLAFEAYSGETDTFIKTKLATALFQAYSATTDTFIKTKLDRLAFEAYSGETKIVIDSKLATALFAAYSATTDTFIKTKLATTIFAAYSAATKIVIDSKLATALFEAYSAATKIVTDSKLATTIFAAYTGATKTIIDSKLAITAFEAYSGETDTFIKTKLDTDVFTGFTASTKNVDKKIQVVSISTANANTVAVTKIDWDSAPVSADTYLFSGGTSVWIKSPGKYEAQYHVLLNNDAANQTHSIGGSLLKNGTTEEYTSTAGMIVGPNMKAELSLPPTVLTLAANDKLELVVFRIGNIGNVTLVKGLVHLMLNKLT